MEKILVMGGGGFLMEPENPLLDLYALSLTQKSKPKVCFVATASGDSQNNINNFNLAFQKVFGRSHLSLLRKVIKESKTIRNL